MKPTLSPQDPKFAAWWEGADGLMIQAEAAESEDKLSEALSLYEKAAQLGNAGAEYKCGEMYDDGRDLHHGGTPKDKDKAAKALYWYEKAAEQGHEDAQLTCSLWYDNGYGTTVNKAKALYWMEKRAERGDATAQFACGMRYILGEGTEPDLAKAKEWIQKAAAQTEDKEIQEQAKEYLRDYF